MACDVRKFGQHGYLEGVCALTALTILLLLSANRATVAADQLPPRVSGVPNLPPHEATFYPSLPPNKARKCDRMFISNTVGLRNGTFQSPNFTMRKEVPPHQCIYTFIAQPGERVRVVFTRFTLRGSPPECNHEYLDLYTEIPSPEADLITTPFGGRYCGRMVPRPRISLYRTLVLGFYSDQKHVDGVFGGFYEFINDTVYNVGTRIANTTCSYNIISDNNPGKKEGEFMSPTYPGVYPKNLVCSYIFRGAKNQRVRLEFMDFDLFFGGGHCPFDHVKVFDGATTDAPLIGTYCGQKHNLVLYSSGEELHVQFATLQRSAETQNRGFLIFFEFSENYVSLNFMRNNGGEHIRGSECDQKILSKKESNGTVFSPNYPFLYHRNIICRYFIYGLQDVQNLEHVRLQFEKFEMPSQNETCADTHLKLYLRGQEDVMAFDKPDFIFCGGSLPPVIVSEGPRLVMVFSSGSSQGLGFKARYLFETEYLIPGTQAPDHSCQFKYLSTSRKSGDLNSPRYPTNYPSNITCTYMIIGQRNEEVRILFDQFKVKTSNATMHGDACQNDWVELYNVYPDDSNQLIGRYCGGNAPGPIISDIGSSAIKLVFMADVDKDVASGFKVRYAFEPRGSIYGGVVTFPLVPLSGGQNRVFPHTTRYDDWPPEVPSSSATVASFSWSVRIATFRHLRDQDCGSNVSGTDYGVLTSPRYPEQYAAHSQSCNWYIYVKPRHKVLLQFMDFTVEGDLTTRGCPSATVRVWKDLISPPLEICGEALTLGNLYKQILSSGNMMRFTFITADKSVGERGFKAIWTEIKEGPQCDLFQCKVSGFCIPPTLSCNGVPNCGVDDNSDETNCGAVAEVNLLLIVGLMVGVASVVLLSVCFWCHRKRKRRRRHRSEAASAAVANRLPPPENRLSCQVPGARFSSMDSV